METENASLLQPTLHQLAYIGRYNWPYKSFEVTAYQKRERTSTRNKSLEDTDFLIVPPNVESEELATSKDFEIGLI